ncbi:MAG TPA: indolepyruvate ferredoxin oxidoreductase [Bacteroidales bacterium]|nr:indolepyruvate ferredoxin oxidoreductase [Bacteroidales bacterium]
MQKLLLLGDEAIAQGAIDSGISGFYGYPGTPSTEIIEYAQKSSTVKDKGIHCEWSANEKTAMEAALGMSYAGKRAIVTMKHVGLNVAADAFINSAITGVNGGLIIVVADDPSMHSSQNEQDSRFYGKYAMIPVLEPVNQQEAYDMMAYGFDLSEKFKLPVLLRITTRLAHSRSGVHVKMQKDQNALMLPDDPRQFVLLPSIAKVQYNNLINNQANIEQAATDSPFNKLIDGKDHSIGIITTGIAYNYLMENYPNGCPYPILKIAHYPLSHDLVNKLIEKTDTLMIVEEGYPIIEEMMRGFLGHENLTIKGRLDNTLPRTGELNPNHLAKALGITLNENYDRAKTVVPRPPSMCPGCGHIYFYKALNEAMEEYGRGKVFSDIGCYTLGALSPFNAINSCVDMGASITMAKGASDAGLRPSVAVIGDSTFTHSGMTGLLDAIREKTPMTVFILDNSTVGMTGGQNSAATARIDDICKGLGVDSTHYHVVNPVPKEHENMVNIFKEELAFEGLSVIVPRRECVQTYTRRMRQLKKVKSEKV